MQSCKVALDRLCAPEFEVSAHYLISQKGDTLQMVAQEDRAWHAGAGAWGGCDDINSNSIGIELDNNGETPFSEPQIAALEALLPEIMQRWAIAPHRIIGHSDMAAHRKFDPGQKFDWLRLAHQNLSVWPELNTEPSTNAPKPDFAKWRAQAATFGYSLNPQISDAATLQAFRDRFRSGVQGALDPEDMRIIENLARRFPVDAGATKP